MTEIVGVGQLALMDLNDAIISGAPPSNPVVGTLWIDESQDPTVLKKWNGEAWVDLGELDPDLSVTIEEITETLGNMANDNVINFQERQVIKDKLTEIIGYVIADTTTTLPTVATLDGSGKGGFWSVRKSARNVGISTSHATYVNVATRYNNLKSYLEGLTPIDAWDTRNANADVVIPVTKSTFRDIWLQYYSAVDALAELTAQKIKENEDALRDDVNAANGELSSLTGRVTKVESKVTDESIINAVTRTEKWIEQINTIDKSIDTAEKNSLVHLRFNGESSYVDFGSVFNDNYTSFSFQLDLRYKGQGNKRGTFGYVVHKNDSSDEGSAPFVIYVNGKDIIVQVRKVVNNYRYITLTDGYNDNIFYNIAVTFSNGTLRAYVDGELKREVAGLTFTNNTGSLAIGGDAYGGGSYNRYFDGVIKNVSVWNKALTKEEIISNMEYIEEGTSNLIHYWKLDEGMGNIAIDNVNNMNGTIYGATWQGSAMNAINILAERVGSVEQNITADGIFTSITQTESWDNIMSQFAQSDSLGDLVTKDELGELSENVDSKINNAIQGIDFEPYATKLELEQTSRNLTTKFSATGGRNLLKNSIGFAELDFWNSVHPFEVGGKNLLVDSNTIAGYELNGNIVPSTAVHRTMQDLVEISPMEKVIYQVWNPNKTVNLSNSNRIAWFDINKKYISSMNLPLLNGNYQISKLTPPNNAYYMRIGVINGSNSIIDKDIKIKVEKGNIATDWIPAPEDNLNVNPLTIKNTELDTLGFGSGFHFSGDGKIKGLIQKVPATVGQPYTLSWYVNKYSSSLYDGEVRIEIIEDDTVTVMKQFPSNEVTAKYEHGSGVYIPNSGIIYIRIVGGAKAEAIITGLMLNIGDVPLQWSLATGEVYNTNIRMDINGIKVSQLDKDKTEIGYTQITPNEFAGYYDSDGNGVFEKVFFLNGEETVTKKFRALNEITMGEIKVININSGGRNGWAFVPITDND